MPGFFLALNVQMIHPYDRMNKWPEVAVKMVHVQSAKIGTIKKTKNEQQKQKNKQRQLTITNFIYSGKFILGTLLCP